MRYGAMNFPIKPVLKELEAFAHLGFDYLELTLDPRLPLEKASSYHFTCLRMAGKEGGRQRQVFSDNI